MGYSEREENNFGGYGSRNEKKQKIPPYGGIFRIGSFIQHLSLNTLRSCRRNEGAKVRDLFASTRLVALEAVHRPPCARLEWQLGNRRPALRAGEVYVVHLARATRHAAVGAGAASRAKTVAAVHRTIAGGLKRKLGNVRAALGALHIHRVHLPLTLIHRFVESV